MQAAAFRCARTQIGSTTAQLRKFSTDSAPSSFKDATSPSVYDADFSRFKLGDIVLLRPTENPEGAPILTRRLEADGTIQSHRGAFKHSDIIGKLPRELVRSSAGSPMRLHFPTLGEFVTLAPRRVTPIYPGEANLIVSLLDIHATTADGKRLEVLEAGTGNGSLTLHLSRAMHSGSHMLPRHLRPKLHTLDISPNNSRHAWKLVQGFRRGVYADGVQFECGTIPEWINKQQKERGSSEAFLDRAVLDLPGPEEFLPLLASAVKADGIIALFCPSITQVGECVQLIKRASLPFALDSVVELGGHVSGGRPWDVKMTRLRSTRRLLPPAEEKRARAIDQSSSEVQETPVAQPTPSGQESLEALERLRLQAEEEEASPLISLDGNVIAPAEEDRPERDQFEEWKLVCRPKFGSMVTAGGFLGLWRRERRD